MLCKILVCADRKHDSGRTKRAGMYVNVTAVIEENPLQIYCSRTYRRYNYPPKTLTQARRIWWPNGNVHIDFVFLHFSLLS